MLSLQIRPKINTLADSRLDDLTRALGKKVGYTSLCLDIGPQGLEVARYCLQVGKPLEQLYYLNSSTLEKLFNTFVSKRTDNKRSYSEANWKNRFGLSILIEGEQCERDARLLEESKQRRLRVNTGWRKKINRLQTGAHTAPGFIRVVGSEKKSAAATNSSSKDDQHYRQDPV